MLIFIMKSAVQNSKDPPITTCILFVLYFIFYFMLHNNQSENDFCEGVC